jgi:hypothetical protein
MKLRLSIVIQIQKYQYFALNSFSIRYGTGTYLTVSKLAFPFIPVVFYPWIRIQVRIQNADPVLNPGVG